jgi:hypothetical protein
MEARDATLDESTADRLLRGRLPVDDAPPRYRGVAELTTLMRAEPTGVELGGETEAVATITAAIRTGSESVTPHSRRTPMSKQRIAQLAAAGTVATMSLFGGLAAANALPGAAQGVASDVLGQLHITVPHPNDHAGTHADSRGQSSAHTSSSTPTSGPGVHGSTISGDATDPGTTGLDKGKAVSSAASGGQSQAGQNGQNSTSSDNASSGTPPVSTPVGPPVSTPVGPPVSTPVGPPVSTPVGPPVSTPVGPPVSTPVGPPVSVPNGKP